jgi:hypothetical protein
MDPISKPTGCQDFILGTIGLILAELTQGDHLGLQTKGCENLFMALVTLVALGELTFYIDSVQQAGGHARETEHNWVEDMLRIRQC